RVTASPFGQIGKVSLQDGSSVTLAPDSKLFVPTVFNEKIRPVKVDGSAAFDVAKGDNDFRVYARNAIITAKGTKFVTGVRWSDTAVVVKVLEGSVEVRVDKGASQSVGAGQAVVVNKAGAIHEATKDETEEAASWVENQRLAMIDRPLKDILPEL